MRVRTAASTILIAALALACGDGSGTGTLSTEITDAPFPASETCLTGALLTVDGVSAKTGDDFTDIALVAPDPDGRITVDLLALRAGLMESLAIGELETGELSEVRLHVVESVLTFDDAPPVDFKCPSCGASGLKIKIDPPALILEDQTTELIFDVDLARSFNSMGLGGETPTCDELKLGDNVGFRPVIRVNNVATDGIVLGTVEDGLDMGVGDVEVCAYVADTDIAEPEAEPEACTFSASAAMDEIAVGDYALLLPAGIYDLYVREQGEEDRSLAEEDVLVTAGDRLEGVDLMLP